MAWIDGVRGVLFDIDGTLLSGDRAIPGAADCLARLREAGVAYRLTTNTTRRSRADTTAALRAAGIEVEADAVLQPAVLARRSPGFFRLALEALQVPAEQVLVVGDDAVNDGRGGAQAGCRTALVRTGKFRAADLDGADFHPDLVLDSVAALGT